MLQTNTIEVFPTVGDLYLTPNKNLLAVVKVENGGTSTIKGGFYTFHGAVHFKIVNTDNPIPLSMGIQGFSDYVAKGQLKYVGNYKKDKLLKVVYF